MAAPGLLRGLVCKRVPTRGKGPLGDFGLLQPFLCHLIRDRLEGGDLLTQVSVSSLRRQEDSGVTCGGEDSSEMMPTDSEGLPPWRHCQWVSAIFSPSLTPTTLPSLPQKVLGEPWPLTLLSSSLPRGASETEGASVLWPLLSNQAQEGHAVLPHALVGPRAWQSMACAQGLAHDMQAAQGSRQTLPEGQGGGQEGGPRASFVTRLGVMLWVDATPRMQTLD